MEAFDIKATQAAFAREDIGDRVLKCITEVSGQSREEICRHDGDIHLCDDIGLDSLERIELAMQLEEEFGLEITDDDVDRLDPTVQGLVAYLAGRLE